MFFRLLSQKTHKLQDMNKPNNQYKTPIILPNSQRHLIVLSALSVPRDGIIPMIKCLPCSFVRMFTSAEGLPR
jgi:hypothetical protein